MYAFEADDAFMIWQNLSFIVKFKAVTATNVFVLAEAFISIH
jgi:hypothetical protein